MTPSGGRGAARAVAAGGVCLTTLREALAWAPRDALRGLAGDAARALRAAPPLLPRVLAAAAVESRLDQPGGRADYCVLVRGDDWRAAAGEPLARRAPAGRWRRVARFLDAWAAAGPLARGISDAWLEFDVERGRARPFVVATIDRRRGPSDPRGAAVRDALAAALPLLGADALPIATQRLLAQALARLPRPGELWHVAVRPRRDGAAVRLVVRCAAAVLPRYLTALDWRGDAAALRAWLPVGRDAGNISVNLDLCGGALAPRVGLEFPHATTATSRALLTRLVAAGACHARLVAPLLAWPDPGRATWLPHVHRDLMIKVVVGRGRVRAKAYLQYVPLFGGG